MKKRILSLMLVLTMVLSLLPMSAFAADVYDVWVGGVKFTENNLTIKCGNGTATYDRRRSEVILDNATITDGYGDNTIGIRIGSDMFMRIVLRGNNTIDARGYGIKVDGFLNLIGNGNLTINSGYEGIECENGHLYISGGCDLNITAAGAGIRVYGNGSKVLLNGNGTVISVRGEDIAIKSHGTTESPVGGSSLLNYSRKGDPSSRFVEYRLYEPIKIEDVAITGLDEPVIGNYPDTSFTITNSQDYPLTASVIWWKYVNGFGRPMSEDAVFEVGAKYSCDITIDTSDSHPFKYYIAYDSNNVAHPALLGTLTVNGENQDCTLSRLSDDLLHLRISWWAKEAQVSMPFVDVKEGDFFFDPVRWAVSKGITNGVDATHFGPGNDCLRAQVVTFLWRAAGEPEPKTTNNPFVDVKSSDFYYKPVLWAVEKGITSGMDATHFGPMEKCNRAQVVTFLYRAAGSPSVSGSNPFADVPKGSFYEAPVLWAVAKGITNGMDATHFGPGSTCNRAQIVTFLYRAYK